MVEQMKSTPGPWENRGGGIVSARVPTVEEFEGGTLTTELTFVCYCGDVNGLAANHEANAHLIAAAPQMLEALKALIEAHERSYDPIHKDAIAQARAALASAQPEPEGGE